MRMNPGTGVVRVVAVATAVLLLLGVGDRVLWAQSGPPAEPQLSPEQLDSLLAPIALYPDPLLGQILAASVYPLEIVEAYRWLQQHSKLKGSPLTDAAREQDWDPSIQAMVVFPSVLKMMNDSLEWTTNLGDAFLAQQLDVMDAIQRMRSRAMDAGQLTNSPQQKVVTMDNSIEIQPADPQVVSVPVYTPAVIWGSPGYYPYPPVYYPFGAASIVAAGAVSFAAGVALGAAFNGCCGWGGWGWGCGWSSHTVIINNHFYNRYGYENYRHGEVNTLHGDRPWSFNPEHRHGVPYPNRELAQKYGAASRQVRTGAPSLRGPEVGRPAQAGEEGAGREVGRAGEPGREPGRRGEQGPGREFHGERNGQGERPGSERERGGGGSAFGGMEPGKDARAHSDRGFNSLGGRGYKRGGAGFDGGGHGGGRGGGGSRDFRR
jgi:hypothetical protein